jgi:hypothetical protein
MDPFVTDEGYFSWVNPSFELARVGLNTNRQPQNGILGGGPDSDRRNEPPQPHDIGTSNTWTDFLSLPNTSTSSEPDMQQTILETPTLPTFTTGAPLNTMISLADILTFVAAHAKERESNLSNPRYTSTSDINGSHALQGIAPNMLNVHLLSQPPLDETTSQVRSMSIGDNSHPQQVSNNAAMESNRHRYHTSGNVRPGHQSYDPGSSIPNANTSSHVQSGQTDFLQTIPVVMYTNQDSGCDGLETEDHNCDTSWGKVDTGNKTNHVEVDRSESLPEAQERNGMIWGMPVESYKALSATERKRVRNRLSARSFRAKKKGWSSVLRRNANLDVRTTLPTLLTSIGEGFS